MNAVHQRVGRKSSEYDGVRSTDAGAGEQGDGKFGRHAHVDCDPVAFFYAKRL